MLVSKDKTLNLKSQSPRIVSHRRKRTAERAAAPASKKSRDEKVARDAEMKKMAYSNARETDVRMQEEAAKAAEVPMKKMEAEDGANAFSERATRFMLKGKESRKEQERKEQERQQQEQKEQERQQQERKEREREEQERQEHDRREQERERREQERREHERKEHERKEQELQQQ